jgi:hypothetical protein
MLRSRRRTSLDACRGNLGQQKIASTIFSRIAGHPRSFAYDARAPCEMLRLHESSIDGPKL